MEIFTFFTYKSTDYYSTHTSS